jgi:putative RecB family exonuclease
MLQLIYLSDAQIVRLTPDEGDLAALERTLQALATAIDRAESSGEFRPRPSRLCDWCSHKALCPAWGGTPPPYPGPADSSPSESSPAESTEGSVEVPGRVSSDMSSVA